MTGVRAAHRADRRAWLRLLWCLGIALGVLLLAPLALAASPRLIAENPPGDARIAASQVGDSQSVAAVAEWGPDAGTRAHVAAVPVQEQADRLLTEFDVDTDGSVIVTETIASIRLVQHSDPVTVCIPAVSAE